ncbi:hypothetical protein [Streptosporangium sp. NPDC006007]|uniref:hypothetical protein n=1 Tax=Streptosporangium sp. NPDC006007 TaxID=3154575 RepID=UPI0033A4F244
MSGEVLVPRKVRATRDEIPAVHDVSPGAVAATLRADGHDVSPGAVTAALRATGAGETAPLYGPAALTSAAVGTVHKGLAGTNSLIGRCANPAPENGADAHVPSRRDSSGRPARR